jgi:sensor domain CHASE-containing protein
MRAITGWRFLIAIVLPLALASLGAVGLTFDLLSRVESSSNRAENARNRIAISEALYGEARELGRLALENSHWEEAFQKTADTVDTVWFRRAWGETISVGASYDIVAVVRATDGDVVVHNAPSNVKHVSLKDLTGANIRQLRSGLSDTGETPGLLTGFVYTHFGPAAVSVSPISNPNGWAAADPKLLVFVRLITDRRLEILEKQLLISNLKFMPPNVKSVEEAALKDLLGNRGLSVTWQNLAMGELVTGFAWRKAGMVLGFMIVVMSGIALVCWRLVQQITSLAWPTGTRFSAK